MQDFRDHCLPVLSVLLLGCETWALTKKQAKQLEVVHSDGLRQILNALC
jgi:hypothetical protein